MNRLPTETVTEIVSHLKALLLQDLPPYYTPKLSAYSTINQTWQAVIERHTFRTIGITSDNLPTFTSLLSGPAGTNRIRSLRELEFHYVRDQVPYLTPTQHAELQSLQQLADESFSQDTVVLFSLLKGWEERLDAAGGVAWGRYQLRHILATECREDEEIVWLPLSPVEVPSPRPRTPVNVPTDEPVVNRGPIMESPSPPLYESPLARRPTIDARYVGGEELPELRIVSEMVTRQDTKIHPETLMQILSRMRCMDCFGGAILEEATDLEITRENRKVLAQHLHLLPRSVTRFSPRFWPCEFDPLATYSVLLDPLRDHLCLSMRALSSRFRTLHLKGFRLSTSIFAGVCDGSYPDWSGLEELHIGYPVMSSAGQWFATAAPPTEPVIQYDPFVYIDSRINFSLPNPALLNELYAAAGRARQHMPALKSLNLTLDVDTGEHNFKYEFDYQLKRNGVFLESTVPFEFSGEVAEAWGFGLGDVKTREAKDTLYEVVL